MLPAPKGTPTKVSADGLDEAGDKQMLGRQLWRILPFIKPYKVRFTIGILSNAIARAFDLLPFVAMGLLTDAVLRDEVETLQDYAFYGFLILGGFTSVPGVIVGGLIIGVGEKVAELYWGDALGGSIEEWFAYVLALVFLMFRPQGLFGEKIIERV